ncbi:MAG TPA: M36 family metallopeptidase [Actinomycetota bacterium]
MAATIAMIALMFGPVPGTSVAQNGVTVDDAIDIAFDHVQGDPEALGVTAEDVAELAVASAYRSDHNQVVHVNLRQFHEGDPVGNSHVTVNVAGDGTVLFVGHNLESVSEDEGDVAFGPVAAVRAAADALGLDPDGLRVLGRGGASVDAVVSGGGISDQPIPAGLIWEPTQDGLRKAWDLVIDDATTASLWSVAVDAETGELLRQDDWTDHDTLAGLASGLARFEYSPGDTTFLEPINSVDDGSSYRVFQAPTESPLDHDRRLVENPAEATASPFGWHDTDGVPGPEFTITRGNNVHAYTDHDNSNDPDEGKTVVIVDPPSSAAGEYVAVQASFGPDIPMGGVSGAIELGDDGMGTNVNDGCEPYTVSAGAIALVDRGQCNFTVKVLNGQNGGAAAVIVANNQPTPPFAMGGNDPAITIPSVMISMDDGNTVKAGLPATGSMQVIPLPTPSAPDGGAGLDFDYPIDLTTEHPHDYWDAAVTNLFYMNNVIHDVMYRLGFNEVAGNFQVTNYNTGLGNGGDDVRAEAQDGGGTNNANFATPAMDGGRPRMQMYLWTLGTPVRDGDFENGIIIHEYGHGISNRLTGGPTVNCLNGDERMGEGWSDYYAITMLADPTLDDPDGPRGMGPYALFQDSRQDGGIRPRPYSRDMNIQPFTYDRIKTGAWITGGSLATPHGVGHAWAATLWDMTWNLIDRHGFNPNIYEPSGTGGNNLALQLVTDGLKFQGCAPGFVVGRDAILAADQALTGGENACIIWASFARRGLGFSAVQGTTDRDDNAEAFDTHPACAAPGTGFSPPVSNTTLNTFDAGETVPLMFNIGEDRGPNPLASNSPASQEIDCTTRTAVQYAITTNTDSTNGKLTFNKNLQRYHYNWATSADWAGTCRQVIITLDDGTQLRADFRFE